MNPSRAGNFEIEDLNVVAELPATLIKARISQGLSQRDLAERLSLKEQQIQRYEATDYAVRKPDGRGVKQVVSALGVEANTSAPTMGPPLITVPRNPQRRCNRQWRLGRHKPRIYSRGRRQRPSCESLRATAYQPERSVAAGGARPTSASSCEPAIR